MANGFDGLNHLSIEQYLQFENSYFVTTFGTAAGGKEFFAPSIPKLFCYMLHSPPLFVTITSARTNSPGGGITTLVFIVSILERHIRLRLLPSLSSSAVSGPESSTASTSVINVVRVSPFKLVLCILSSDDKMFLTDFIYRSHTPLICLAVGVFLVEIRQSAPFS